MAENFDYRLVKNADQLSSILNNDLKNNMKIIREIYSKLQSCMDMAQEKIDTNSNIIETDKIKFKYFLKEINKIPFSSLSDEELLAILFNYNITPEYIDEISNISRKLVQ